MPQYDDRGRLRLSRPGQIDFEQLFVRSSGDKVPSKILLSPADPTARFNTDDLCEVAALHPSPTMRLNALKSLAGNGDLTSAVLDAFVSGLRGSDNAIRSYCYAHLADNPFLVRQAGIWQEAEVLRQVTPDLDCASPGVYLAISIIEALPSKSNAGLLDDFLKRSDLTEDLREHASSALANHSPDLVLAKMFEGSALECRMEDPAYKEALSLAKRLRHQAFDSLQIGLRSEVYPIFLNTLRIFSELIAPESEIMNDQMKKHFPQMARGVLRFLSTSSIDPEQERFLLRVYAKFGEDGLEAILSRSRDFPGMGYLISEVNPRSYAALAKFGKNLERGHPQRAETIQMMIRLSPKVNAAASLLLHAARVHDHQIPEVMRGLTVILQSACSTAQSDFPNVYSQAPLKIG